MDNIAPVITEARPQPQQFADAQSHGDRTSFYTRYFRNRVVNAFCAIASAAALYLIPAAGLVISTIFVIKLIYDRKVSVVPQDEVQPVISLANDDVRAADSGPLETTSGSGCVIIPQTGPTPLTTFTERLSSRLSSLDASKIEEALVKYTSLPPESLTSPSMDMDTACNSKKDDDLHRHTEHLGTKQDSPDPTTHSEYYSGRITKKAEEELIDRLTEKGYSKDQADQILVWIKALEVGDKKAHQLAMQYAFTEPHEQAACETVKEKLISLNTPETKASEDAHKLIISARVKIKKKPKEKKIKRFKDSLIKLAAQMYELKLPPHTFCKDSLENKKASTGKQKTTVTKQEEYVETAETVKKRQEVVELETEATKDSLRLFNDGMQNQDIRAIEEALEQSNDYQQVKSMAIHAKKLINEDDEFNEVYWLSLAKAQERLSQLIAEQIINRSPNLHLNDSRSISYQEELKVLQFLNKYPYSFQRLIIAELAEMKVNCFAEAEKLFAKYGGYKDEGADHDILEKAYADLTIGIEQAIEARVTKGEHLSDRAIDDDLERIHAFSGTVMTILERMLYPKDAVPLHQPPPPTPISQAVEQVAVQEEVVTHKARRLSGNSARSEAAGN